MSGQVIAIVTLSIVLAVLSFTWVLLALANRRNFLRRFRLERWLRGNLLLMRMHCSRVSPEAIAVINSLERALPDMARVDGEALENYLYVLKRAREAGLLETVTAIEDEKERVR